MRSAPTRPRPVHPSWLRDVVGGRAPAPVGRPYSVLPFVTWRPWTESRELPY